MSDRTTYIFLKLFFFSFSLFVTFVLIAKTPFTDSEPLHSQPCFNHFVQTKTPSPLDVAKSCSYPSVRHVLAVS